MEPLYYLYKSDIKNTVYGALIKITPYPSGKPGDVMFESIIASTPIGGTWPKIETISDVTAGVSEGWLRPTDLTEFRVGTKLTKIKIVSGGDTIENEIQILAINLRSFGVITYKYTLNDSMAASKFPYTKFFYEFLDYLQYGILVACKSSAPGKWVALEGIKNNKFRAICFKCGSKTIPYDSSFTKTLICPHCLL